MWGHDSDKVAWGGPATLCPVLTLGGRGLPWAIFPGGSHPVRTVPTESPTGWS